jgi:iron uptake system component EfeO
VSLRRLLPVLPGVLLLALTACSSDAGSTGAASSSAGAVSVTASDDACELSATEVPAGAATFTITNSGSKVTEVYVYAGDKVVTEKENIGPGTRATVEADLAAGTYEVACKPGMTGDGIRTTLTAR